MAFSKVIRCSFVVFFLASVPIASVAEEPQTSAPGVQESVLAALPVAPISLDLRDAELKPLLRALGQQFKLNLLVNEDVKGQITLSLKDVPFREALQAITRANGLLLLPGPGNIIEILPVQTYQTRLQQLAASSPAPKVEPLASLVTQKVEVQYAFNPRDSISAIGREINMSGKQVKDLNELADLLKKRLSGRPGSDIAVISRLNALMITDTPQRVEEIVGVIKGLDVPEQTVGIEARIAEVTKQALEDLGVQWGGLGKFGIATLTGGIVQQSSTTTTSTSTSTTTGTSTINVPQSGGIGLSGNNFVTNLPANIPLGGPGSSFAFTIGKTASKVLDIQLSALEQEGKLKLLAAPRLTTMNHERAWIENGQQIPYRNISVSATGISTFTVEFKQASIELEVTPHIIIKNGASPAIALEVLTGRKEADFAHAIEGNPPLITRTIYTRALVQEGETAVIGGLKREDTTHNDDRVPFLSDIPFLGWLFKRTAKNDIETQLMVFLTPTILPTPMTTTEPSPTP